MLELTITVSDDAFENGGDASEALKTIAWDIEHNYDKGEVFDYATNVKIGEWELKKI